jgi:HSP20 family protein
MSEGISIPTRSNGSSSAKAYQRLAMAPPVDMFENADELLLVADVPGVSSDGIELRVENGTLTLEARRPEKKDEASLVAREYDEADFITTFRIPPGIDTGAIAAETKDGTLLVRLPKAATAKPRKIAVRSHGED